MFRFKQGHTIAARLQRQCFVRGYSSIQGHDTVKLEYTRNSSNSTDSGRLNAPLVVLHGLFGSKQNWGAISRRLSQELERDVYSVDQRNHGDSGHLSPHTYAAMSADLVRFIEDHKLDSPILVGHSMGGKVVMHTALERPDLVSQLIVDDMVPAEFHLHHDFKGYVDKLLEIESRNVASQKEMDQMLAETEPDLSIRQFLLTNMKKSKDPGGTSGVRGVYRSRIPLKLLGDSLRSMMAWDAPDGLVFNGPTLFIAGAKSPYIKPYAYPVMNRLFPNYELEELDTGHWVHAEMPREFMDLVVRFIRKNESTNVAN
ncbi:hypothetical protein IW140_001428 [Coemansia sp. RSA 1813]|nr:hypothetical protein EV178_001075 [Coemansia sp. RSA 1646]KAJ1766772.1 hypothetical protein LPJ74_005713 [Coemansia sp. RSA 1843]KAJ2091817.1 hypothetical protein IW138_001506 [Coemansia sp. RSA 986]KAJ2215857.1 hypothetical protein EV179_001877 [Coemansia sp. RSA 487]KAJ2571787.1 hypothetical protein IW140_001428 [Coemansia sp. RSA 1813]